MGCQPGGKTRKNQTKLEHSEIVSREVVKKGQEYLENVNYVLGIMHT